MGIDMEINIQKRINVNCWEIYGQDGEIHAPRPKDVHYIARVEGELTVADKDAQGISLLTKILDEAWARFDVGDSVVAEGAVDPGKLSSLFDTLTTQVQGRLAAEMQRLMALQKWAQENQAAFSVRTMEPDDC